MSLSHAATEPAVKKQRNSVEKQGVKFSRQNDATKLGPSSAREAALWPDDIARSLDEDMALRLFSLLMQGLDFSSTYSGMP